MPDAPAQPARSPLEEACTAFLSAEFDELGDAWFHPSERANFVHAGCDRVRPKMRAAIQAYLRALAKTGTAAVTFACTALAAELDQAGETESRNGRSP